VKIEVDCFSLLPPAAGTPSGTLKLFHLFFNNWGGRSIDTGLLIAHNITGGIITKDCVHKTNNKNYND